MIDFQNLLQNKDFPNRVEDIMAHTKMEKEQVSWKSGFTEKLSYSKPPVAVFASSSDERFLIKNIIDEEGLDLEIDILDPSLEHSGVYDTVFMLDNTPSEEQWDNAASVVNSRQGSFVDAGAGHALWGTPQDRLDFNIDRENFAQSWSETASRAIINSQWLMSRKHNSAEKSWHILPDKDRTLFFKEVKSGEFEVFEDRHRHKDMSRPTMQTSRQLQRLSTNSPFNARELAALTVEVIESQADWHLSQKALKPSSDKYKNIWQEQAFTDWKKNRSELGLQISYFDMERHERAPLSDKVKKRDQLFSTWGSALAYGNANEQKKGASKICTAIKAMFNDGSIEGKREALYGLGLVLGQSADRMAARTGKDITDNIGRENLSKIGEGEISREFAGALKAMAVQQARARAKGLDNTVSNLENIVSTGIELLQKMPNRQKSADMFTMA